MLQHLQNDSLWPATPVGGLDTRLHAIAVHRLEHFSRGDKDIIGPSVGANKPKTISVADQPSCETRLSGITALGRGVCIWPSWTTAARF
jgi:hypothetical protein